MGKLAALAVWALTVSLPLLLLPHLPDGVIYSIAFYPPIGIGLPLMVGMIQGIRLWNGET